MLSPQTLKIKVIKPEVNNDKIAHYVRNSFRTKSNSGLRQIINSLDTKFQFTQRDKEMVIAVNKLNKNENLKIRKNYFKEHSLHSETMKSKFFKKMNSNLKDVADKLENNEYHDVSLSDISQIKKQSSSQIFSKPKIIKKKDKDIKTENFPKLNIKKYKNLSEDYINEIINLREEVKIDFLGINKQKHTIIKDFTTNKINKIEPNRDSDFILTPALKSSKSEKDFYSIKSKKSKRVNFESINNKLENINISKNSITLNDSNNSTPKKTGKPFSFARSEYKDQKLNSNNELILFRKFSIKPTSNIRKSQSYKSTENPLFKDINAKERFQCLRKSIAIDGQKNKKLLEDIQKLRVNNANVCYFKNYKAY